LAQPNEKEVKAMENNTDRSGQGIQSRFAANLSMLFTEVPFLERFDLARAAGFSYVEYLFPYEYKAAELKQQLVKNRLRQVLFNLPAGNWSGGERGIAANPKRVKEFRQGVANAVEYAVELGVTQLNCLAGKCQAGFDAGQQWAVLVDNVGYAANELHRKGLRLVVEFINSYDMPGSFLTRTEQVLQLIEAVDMSNVFIQYDVYHAQRSEGELAATLRRHIDRIGHIQIADNPGRHQPGTGEINYPFLFSELERLHYPGYIGLEYIPSPDSRSSLAWLADFDRGLSG
jgi:hydroxypyruvate isomerase